MENVKLFQLREIFHDAGSGHTMFRQIYSETQKLCLSLHAQGRDRFMTLVDRYCASIHLLLLRTEMLGCLHALHHRSGCRTHWLQVSSGQLPTGDREVQHPRS